jgi:quinol monooxygenase YgiN
MMALRNLRVPATAEAGMINYEVFQSEENELHYYVRETWESEEALRRHLLNRTNLQLALLNF